ncbi:LemA family protein [Undibacterium sp. TC4M20W]|uniref:LemA family protein n=1 Tax=Undibacterium sp. TC4M20W TaxID=3413052 RepID=UPI003BF37592
MIAMIVLAVIFAILAFWVLGIQKRLLNSRRRIKYAFSQMDIQFKRRYELIPNLVEIAKGYMKHEREALEAIITALNEAVSANAMACIHPLLGIAILHLATTEDRLTVTLGRMFAIAEACPDLQANENMQRLTTELNDAENKLIFARQAYNDCVVQYNQSMEHFPGPAIANIFGFHAAELMQVAESDGGLVAQLAVASA